MRLATEMKNARIWRSAGFATITPWRAGRVLALGALLAIGTGLYFNMTAGAKLEVSSPAAATEDQSTVSSRVVPDQLVIDVQQEAGSWDANEPAASSAVKPSTESLPGSDDFYWPPVLENYYSSQPETIIDVQQKAGSWDANKPAAPPSVKPAAESLPGIDDYYWPPVLEKRYLSQAETIIDVQQETGSWDGIKPAPPSVEVGAESLPGSDEGTHGLP